MLYSFIKPLLFALDPEDAHHLILKIASLSPTLGAVTGAKKREDFAVKVGHTTWASPIGLAAGLDKNADALSFFDAQGFGAIECGTVTLQPQEGNPRPRMFRYPQEESLRNAMGFPNSGLLDVLDRVKNFKGTSALGVNIGKNKETTAEESIEELTILLDCLKDQANYFVVNVSSPNTPGLRDLQEPGYLKELFSELNKVKGEKDLYIKISPDLEINKVHELISISEEMKLTGLIATNTTIMFERGVGGISGKLLKNKSSLIQEEILKNTNLELIAVGGISSPEDLFDLWKQGGKAAQIYTAYIYQGPALLKRFAQEFERFTRFQKMSLMDFFTLSKEERKYRLKNF